MSQLIDLTSIEPILRSPRQNNFVSRRVNDYSDYPLPPRPKEVILISEPVEKSKIILPIESEIIEESVPEHIIIEESIRESIEESIEEPIEVSIPERVIIEESIRESIEEPIEVSTPERVIIEESIEVSEPEPIIISESIQEEILVPTKYLSPGEMTAFSPPKQISVAAVSDNTLKTRLHSDDYEIRKEAVKDLERRIATMEGKCPDDIVNNLRVRTFQLNLSTLNEYIEQSYDHNFQDGFGCLIDALLAVDPINNRPDDNLRQWVSEVKRIGKKSAEGQVFSLKSGNFPLFAIKIPIKSADDTLPHEAVVGMGALNSLRDRIPNFMHTYGSFMCAPPVIDVDNRIVSWCPSDSKINKVTYLILENLENTESLDTMASTLNEDEFLQIYLQVLNALNLAYKRFDFTHYDLHTGNVLVQRLPYFVTIPFYHPNGRTLYLKTKLLARIIDYGMSHIKIEGQHFGVFDLEAFQVHPEQSFPIYDAYKLLMFIYFKHIYIPTPEGLIKRTEPNFLHPVISSVHSFFNENIDIDQRIRNRLQNQKYDYFQISRQKYGNRTLDELITYILSTIPISFLFETQPVDTINSICQDNCISWETFNQYIFKQDRLPQNIYEYCTAYRSISKLQDSSYKQELLQWLQQFDLEKSYSEERVIFTVAINGIIKQLNRIELYLIDSPRFDYSIYRQNVLDLLSIRDEYLEYRAWINELSCVTQVQSLIPIVYNDVKNFAETLYLIDTQLNYNANIIQYNRNRDPYYFKDQNDTALSLAQQILIA